MGLSSDEIERIARLARLTVEPSELHELSVQLSRIVELFDQLSAVDTEGVEPMVHAFDLENVMGIDCVIPSLPRNAALGNAPAHDDECFLVPPVMG